MYTFINEGKQFLMKLTQVSETLNFKIAMGGGVCVCFTLSSISSEP